MQIKLYGFKIEDSYEFFNTLEELQKYVYDWNIIAINYRITEDKMFTVTYIGELIGKKNVIKIIYNDGSECLVDYDDNAFSVYSSTTGWYSIYNTKYKPFYDRINKRRQELENPNLVKQQVIKDIDPLITSIKETTKRQSMLLQNLECISDINAKRSLLVALKETNEALETSLIMYDTYTKTTLGMNLERKLK